MPLRVTFALTLVRALQERGVRCFASTTERRTEVEERSDGGVERRSLIRFVRWREYPHLGC